MILILIFIVTDIVLKITTTTNLKLRGPYLQGVKAVIAVSFERIHRSNLVGMGILPLEFKQGEDADALGLTGKETFSIGI